MWSAVYMYVYGRNCRVYRSLLALSRLTLSYEWSCVTVVLAVVQSLHTAAYRFQTVTLDLSLTRSTWRHITATDASVSCVRCLVRQSKVVHSYMVLHRSAPVSVSI